MNLSELYAPDKFRIDNGLKGELALFKAADAQHRTKHPEISVDCNVCVTIARNLDKLKDEVRKRTEGIRTID